MRTRLPDRRALRKRKIRGRDVQTPAVPAVPDSDAGESLMNKVKLATVWLDGCSGCHMSLLDMDEQLIAIADKVDLVYGPLVDFKEFPEWVDVTLVEGSVSSEEDLAKIRNIRAHTKV